MDAASCCMGAAAAALAMHLKNSLTGGARFKGAGGIPRVLVTGFHDFSHEDIRMASYWEGAVNPTGRMICEMGNAGTEYHCPPTMGAYTGPLVRYLRGAVTNVEWEFVTLPVIWGTSGSINYTNYDVVVNLGQNGSLDPDTVAMEKGADNNRKGEDVAGHAPPTAKIEDILDAGIAIPACDAICAALARAPLPRGFTAITAEQRKDNAYICNETHWRTIRAVQAGLIAHGYFIHVPDAPKAADVEALAEAVGALIVTLVQRSVA